MTAPEAFTLYGVDPATATILARQINAGASDPNELCGCSFCDVDAVAVSKMVNSGEASAEMLAGLGLPLELSHAIANSINSKGIRK